MFNCTFFLRMHVRTILASNERKTKRKPTVLSFQDMINMVYLEQSVCTLYVFFSISIVIKMAVLAQNSPQFNDEGCYVTFKVEKEIQFVWFLDGSSHWPVILPFWKASSAPNLTIFLAFKGQNITFVGGTHLSYWLRQPFWQLPKIRKLLLIRTTYTLTKESRIMPNFPLPLGFVAFCAFSAYQKCFIVRFIRNAEVSSTNANILT